MGIKPPPENRAGLHSYLNRIPIAAYLKLGVEILELVF